MTIVPNRLTAVPLNTPGENPRNVATYISARALAAGAAESITIPQGSASAAAPAGAAYVRVAGTADFYYSFFGAATVPADTDDGSACELIKAQGDAEWLAIPAGATTLSVISAAICIVTASFYSN